MDPRETRFWLRFESGERQGQSVPLARGTATVGRRPENQLVIADGSVSGRHAELRIDADAVELVDLGSTNGTRVGGERIEKKQLSHGDRIALGNVNLTLLDASLDAAGLAPARTSAPGSGDAPLARSGAGDATATRPGAGEGLARVSAEHVARAGKRSLLAPLVLGVLVLGALAGGAYVYLHRGGVAAQTAVIPAIPGNLLEGG